MSLTILSRELRNILASSDPLQALPNLLDYISSFVAEASSFSSDVTSDELVNVLHSIYEEYFDQKSVAQVEVVLAILHALDKTLPVLSVITTWFELLLRSSLRNPKLGPSAIKNARCLVLKAMNHLSLNAEEKVQDFRRRVMELYLLDTVSISSHDEAVERAGWNEEERQRRTFWKSNLETILVSFLSINPEEFFSLWRESFSEPSSRLQLILLLRCCVNHDSFHAVAPGFFSHPAFHDLILSLLIDTSSTVFTITLSVMTQLLPHLVLYSPDQISTIVPLLLLILQRALCWRPQARFITSDYFSEDTGYQVLPSLDHKRIAEYWKEIEANNEEEMNALELRTDLQWKRLGSTFDTTASLCPSTDVFFGFLLGMFPCNTILFLRSARTYLDIHPCEPLFTLDWKDVIDEDELKQRTQTSLQQHRMPPGILLFDEKLHAAELSNVDRWKHRDIARIAGECSILDLRSAGQTISPFSANNTTDNAPIPASNTIDVSAKPYPKISVQDMVAASAALKSGIEIELDNPSPLWPTLLFDTLQNSAIASKSTTSSTTSLIPPTLPLSPDISSQVAEAVSSLQRENLLLRNELNFELWLKRESMKHVGRLLQQLNFSHSDNEAELLKHHKTLAHYRRRYSEIQSEFKGHKTQASISISELNSWHKAQEQKISEMRKKERTWLKEASLMKDRSRLQEATIDAQNRLLSDAKKQIFTLETEMKEIKPKLDRLSDFEARIEQLTKMQRLWDQDVQRFNDQAKQMEILISDYQKMTLRVKSLEEANKELEKLSVRAQYSNGLPGREATTSVHTTSKASQDFVKKLLDRVADLESSNEKLSIQNGELRLQLGIT